MSTVYPKVNVTSRSGLELSDAAVYQNAFQTFNVSHLLTIQFSLQSFQSKTLTKLRFKLLGGKFFCFRELRCVGTQ